MMDASALTNMDVTVTPADALIGAVKKLAFAESLPSISDIVTTTARSIAGAHGTTFVLRDLGEKDLCFYYDEDAISPLWKGMKFPSESCISGWSMHQKEQVSIPDIYKDGRIPHDAYQPTFVKSLVMTPVRREDPIAAIGTYWSEEHTATPEELILLQTLADVTAVALEKVQWQEHAHSSKSALEKQQKASSTLNQFRKDLLEHLTHDLRNSVLGLTKLSELVDENQQILDKPNVADVLRNSTRQMLETIEKIIDLDQHLLHDNLHVNSVCLNELQLEIKSNFEELATASNIVFTISSDCEPLYVKGNDDWLRTLFSNLVSNAIRYSPAFGEIKLSLAREENVAVIRISDTGSGIPEELQKDVFNRFWLGDRGENYYIGRGFGLYICKRIVEAHSGQISFVSSSDSGTTFTITLPLAQDCSST